MKILLDTLHYSAIELPESIPVEQSGITLYFHYGTYNKLTEKLEGYFQFLPSAIDQTLQLNEHLIILLEEGKEAIEEVDGNVVPFNS